MKFRDDHPGEAQNSRDKSVRASPQTRALCLTEKTNRRVAPQRSGAPVLAKGAGEGGKRPGVLWSKAESCTLW